MTQKIVSPKRLKLEKIVALSFEDLRYTKFYCNITKHYGPGPIVAKILLEKLQMVLVQQLCKILINHLKINQFSIRNNCSPASVPRSCARHCKFKPRLGLILLYALISLLYLKYHKYDIEHCKILL